MATQSRSVPQACTQSLLCGSQASPAGQVRLRATHDLSVWSQVCVASPQSASEAQGLSESGKQAFEFPQAAPGKQLPLLQVSPAAQLPALQAGTQKVPNAGKSGCAAQALPAPHSAPTLQGWQKAVMARQVRSAVLQYWPLPQPLLEVQPPTEATQRPVKALQNWPR